MTGSIIIRYVNPWKFRRDQNAQRLTAIRGRDGDNCRRCKRPMQFDLPTGHDMLPRVEMIVPVSAGGSAELDNLCLTHVRCNAKHGCDTAEVKERARIKNESDLFAKSKQKRRRSA
ncbi:HNH endonuclease [Sphingomonas daechungensis]|uniref:HNH endonuclease n=1 Tax=Sphingomonas daechungensis TaxID=1176646 RepID=UPI003784F2D1